MQQTQDPNTMELKQFRANYLHGNSTRCMEKFGENELK
jgi:hypothetical protein